MIEPIKLESPHEMGITGELILKVNQLIAGYNELHRKLDPLVAIMHNDGSVDWRHDPTLNSPPEVSRLDSDTR